MKKGFIDLAKEKLEILKDLRLKYSVELNYAESVRVNDRIEFIKVNPDLFKVCLN